MVDIHCHILPEVDDGAWNQETAMEMARMAVRSGTNRIIATPHFQGVPESLEQIPYIFHQYRQLQVPSSGKSWSWSCSPVRRSYACPRPWSWPGWGSFRLWVTANMS